MPTRENQANEDDEDDASTLTPKELEAIRAKALAANSELLKINADIRQFELHLSQARTRRRLSVASYIFGPSLLLLLYTIFWIPSLNRATLTAIYIPGFIIAIGCCIAAFRMAKDPGGGPRLKFSDGAVRRQSEGEIELEIAKQKDAKKLKIADGAFDQKTRRLIYKEEAYTEIEKLRSDSKRYRNVNNFLQGILIIGSIAATGASGVASSIGPLRWVVLGMSLAVGIASGFMGYYKYKERSFYLQQTADAIEHEWEAFEVGVGRYKYIKKENLALKEFVEEVHRLKSEQRKREQNLEQPPETRSVGEL
ncbi:DUF4231 domain-containing protein [Amycolatopsis sp. CA-230715]|uniref:DUF4231 domain-containing protein n=1 Tax=Amycolatopsis sp. CA-230715 TaxID=2745196 RepID=UPI001C0381F9|nr:DUF4231 domain-containing protein [Amycolatopsis sp. CA-230715]QWF81112.1 hypothetical protein HUW46_04538 [Amycolatopsis sp. CA-230715]